MSGLLLDTRALIWVMNGEGLKPEAAELVDAGSLADRLYVSPVSAREIGLLSKRRKVAFKPDPEGWLARAMSLPGLRLLPLTPSAALASSSLPGKLQRIRPTGC